MLNPFYKIKYIHKLQYSLEFYKFAILEKAFHISVLNILETPKKFLAISPSKHRLEVTMEIRMPCL